MSPVRAATPLRSVPDSVGQSSAGSALALGEASGAALVGPSLGWPDEPAKTGAPSFTESLATIPGVTASGLTTPGPSAPVISAAIEIDHPVEVVPLTAERCRLHATVSSQFMKKLEAARDALSHARPEATLGEILEAGLELLLVQAARKKGLVAKPRSGKGSKASAEDPVSRSRDGEGSGEVPVTEPGDGKASTAAVAEASCAKASAQTRTAKRDHIPAHVKREVWMRDGGRCQWRLDSGGICGSTRQLELDRIQPRSRGGASTIDNLRILCRGHNDLAARLLLGERQMNQFTLGLRTAPRGTRASSGSRSEPPHL